MASAVRERPERTHSARYLVLIFLVCVATCGVFFSLGFLVGYNERGSHTEISTESVTTPPVIPPTLNAPPVTAPATRQDPAAGHRYTGSEPETEVVPAGGGVNPSAAAANRGEAAPKPDSNAASPPAPEAGRVGEGITLQVAALRTQQDAKALVDILQSRGYPVFLVKPEYAHSDDNLFRVQVGPFRTRADADKVRDKLVKEGFKPFIRH